MFLRLCFVAFLGVTLSTGLPTDSQDDDTGVEWALIVAGSNGWDNYRHQADACHSYQILHKHGIPDERIVVMMYDDIANNPTNPTPGVIINHPNGPDVYAGVPKDYTGYTVTPENFLKVLQGKDMTGIGSGKTIKSTSKDHVFVYFVDHGGPGIVGFPNSELSSKNFTDALKSMHDNKQYSQMVIYMEACFSGTMFDGLVPDDIKIYATTAANTQESSYACYFDSARETYLGDVYSVMWLEDSDKENLSTETLLKQYQIVKAETNTSHVMQYGDLSLSKETVSLFQGDKTASPSPSLPRVPLNAVPSEQVPLAILQHKLNNAKSLAEERSILNEINNLKKLWSDIEQNMALIVGKATGDKYKTQLLLTSQSRLQDHACYESVRKAYKDLCYDFVKTGYALKHLYALVNLCEEGLSADVIKGAIKAVCTKF